MAINKSRRVCVRILKLVAVSIAALATEAVLACTSSSCSDTVGVIYLTDAGVYVQPTHGLSGLTNCTVLSGGYLTIPKSDTAYPSYYALLVTAKVLNLSVTLRLTDNSNPCTVTYMTMP
jgi:hypothetical protein